MDKVVQSSRYDSAIFHHLSLDLLSVCSLILSDYNTPSWQQHCDCMVTNWHRLQLVKTHFDKHTHTYKLYLLGLGKEGRAGKPPVETE